MYTNAGFDHEAIARQKAQEERDDRFNEAMDRQEKRAEFTKDGRQDICPPILDGGVEYDVDGNEVCHQSTFVHDELGQTGMSHIELTKRALAYGNIQPAAYIREPGKALGRRFKSVTDEQATADAKACWKCGDSTLQDNHLIEDRWRAFQGMFPYYILPASLTPKDICLTCGAQLLKRRAA